MHLPIGLLISLIMFTACSAPSESFTQVNVHSEPMVSVTPDTTSLGSFVDVAVSMVLELDGQSPFEQRSTTFSMGVCIRTPNMLSENGHCVPDEPYTSPSGVQLASESAQFAQFTLTLKRGETRTVTHTFRFTSADPITLYLTGVSKGEKSEQGSIGFGGSIDPEYIAVTFR